MRTSLIEALRGQGPLSWAPSHGLAFDALRHQDLWVSKALREAIGPVLGGNRDMDGQLWGQWMARHGPALADFGFLQNQPFSVVVLVGDDVYQTRGTPTGLALRRHSWGSWSREPVPKSSFYAPWPPWPTRRWKRVWTPQAPTTKELMGAEADRPVYTALLVKILEPLGVTLRRQESPLFSFRELDGQSREIASSIARVLTLGGEGSRNLQQVVDYLAPQKTLPLSRAPVSRAMGSPGLQQVLQRVGWDPEILPLVLLTEVVAPRCGWPDLVYWADVPPWELPVVGKPPGAEVWLVTVRFGETKMEEVLDPLEEEEEEELLEPEERRKESRRREKRLPEPFRSMPSFHSRQPLRRVLLVFHAHPTGSWVEVHDPLDVEADFEEIQAYLPDGLKRMYLAEVMQHGSMGLYAMASLQNRSEHHLDRVAEFCTAGSPAGRLLDALARSWHDGYTRTVRRLLTTQYAGLLRDLRRGQDRPRVRQLRMIQEQREIQRYKETFIKLMS